MSEHHLQIAVAHMLQLVLDPARTWWSAIDHAAKLSKRYGGERKRRGVKRGLPDIIIMVSPDVADRIFAVIGIELKFSKGKLSLPQLETATAWVEMGHTIFVARSLAEVQEILDYCNVPCLRRITLSLEPDHDRRPARAARAGHPGTRRRRKPKGAVPVVQLRPT